jgi:hypothetical protein
MVGARSIGPRKPISGLEFGPAAQALPAGSSQSAWSSSSEFFKAVFLTQEPSLATLRQLNRPSESNEYESEHNENYENTGKNLQVIETPANKT